jgi:hypothetical protein
MPYTRGNSKNIIVGAAALFVADAPLVATVVSSNVTGNDDSYPFFESARSYKDTVADDLDFRNVGYTTNGLEMTFEPDFGEVSVDQVLDVAKMYKQGMKVSMKTSMAESTLENLLVVLALPSNKLGAPAGKTTNAGQVLDLSAGQIGECPVERGIIAVGPGTGDCSVSNKTERVYIAYRALSIESVTLSAKRDEATAFETSFRLLPEDTTGSYGKIVDRTWT